MSCNFSADKIEQVKTQKAENWAEELKKLINKFLALHYLVGDVSAKRDKSRHKSRKNGDCDGES